MQARCGENFHQPVNILFAHQLKQIFWLRGRCKRLPVEQAIADIIGYTDVFPVEALVDQAAVRDDIGRKITPPGRVTRMASRSACRWSSWLYR